MGDKGYEPEPDEQWRRSSAGEDVYTLGSALAEAIQPVYDYFIKKTGCDECAANRHKERSRGDSC